MLVKILMSLEKNSANVSVTLELCQHALGYVIKEALSKSSNVNGLVDFDELPSERLTRTLSYSIIVDKCIISYCRIGEIAFVYY